MRMKEKGESSGSHYNFITIHTGNECGSSHGCFFDQIYDPLIYWQLSHLLEMNHRRKQMESKLTNYIKQMSLLG